MGQAYSTSASKSLPVRTTLGVAAWPCFTRVTTISNIHSTKGLCQDSNLLHMKINKSDKSGNKEILEIQLYSGKFILPPQLCLKNI